MLALPLVNEETLIADPSISHYVLTDAHLVVARGKTVTLVDRSKGTVLGSRSFQASVSGLSLVPEGPEIFVQLPDQFWFVSLGKFPEAELVEPPELLFPLLSPGATSLDASYFRIFPRSRKFLACASRDALYLVARENFGKSPKFTRLHADGVRAVAWRGAVISWASENSVFLYETESQQKIGNFEFPGVTGIFWTSDTRVACVAGATVHVVELEKETNGIWKISSLISFECPVTQVTAVAAFQRGEPDLGIFAAADRKFLLLSPDLDGTALVQEVCGAKFPVAAISVCDTEISCLSEGEISVFRPRSLLEHAEWHLSHGLPGQALKFARASDADSLVLRSVAFASLRPLLEAGRFDEAASLVPDLQISDPLEWTELARLFAATGAADFIAELLPFQGAPLDKAVYTEILKKSKNKALTIIRKWPREIYETREILEAFGENCAENFQVCLLLLQLEGLDQEALELCLELRKTEEFFAMIDLSRRANLAWYAENAQRILTLDVHRGSLFFVENRKFLDPKKIAHNLEATPFLLNTYLWQIFLAAPEIAENLKRQLVLGLLQFRPDCAAQVVRKFAFANEELSEILAYPGNDAELKTLLLWKLGRPMEALDVLLGHKNERRAIEFAREVGDAVLWECLIEKIVHAGDQGKIETLMNEVDAEAKADVFEKIFTSSSVDTVKLTAPLVEGLEVLEAAHRTRRLLNELTLADITEANLRSKEAARGGEPVDLSVDFCSRCRKPIAEGDAYAEFSLQQLSLRETFPNTTTHSPWIAVFRDKRVAHCTCLIDLSY